MSQEWLTVYVTHNLTEAHIIAGRLQHHDIRCWVNEPIGRSALGITVGSLGEVSVLVSPEDYERALALLEQDASSQLPDSTGDVVLRGFDDSPYDEESEYDDEYWDDDVPRE